jgi:hypothetical protein
VDSAIKTWIIINIIISSIIIIIITWVCGSSFAWVAGSNRAGGMGVFLL